MFEALKSALRFASWLLRSVFYDPRSNDPSFGRIIPTLFGVWLMSLLTYTTVMGGGSELGAALSGLGAIAGVVASYYVNRTTGAPAPEGGV